jgi:hypothetical protein
LGVSELELLCGGLELELGGTELDDLALEEEDLAAGFELLEFGGLLDDVTISIDEDVVIFTWFEKWISVFLMREKELEEFLLEDRLSVIGIISMVPRGSRSLCASATSLLQAATTVKMAASMYPLILVI